MLIVMFDVRPDGVDQRRDAPEGTPAKALVGEVPEEAFDQVEP